MLTPKGIRGRMILILMIMTPGIPEYLTGSSKLDAIFQDPSFFFIGLFLNIGLYTTGALLIREFSIRFNKGWLSVLILGVAYGIIEEGISVHTFLLTSGSPVGILGSYGRFAGIDWMWALFISSFHSIFSIGLPLLLLSIAYPRYSRLSLLGRRGTTAVISLFFLDVIVANLLVKGIPGRPFPTDAEYAIMLFLVFFMVLVAFAVPGNIFSGNSRAMISAKTPYFLGLLVFPLYLLFAYFPSVGSFSKEAPPAIEAAAYIAVVLTVGALINRCVPKSQNRKQKFALALGLISPLIVWGEVMQLTRVSQLISLVVIVAVVLLFRLGRWVRAGKYLDPNPLANP